MLSALSFLIWTCQKPEAPENPFDNYNPKQDTVKFIFNDPDSSSIAGLYTFVFKPTCANSGCHDGTFDPDFRTLESSYHTLVFRDAIKQDGQFFIRVKPFAPDESVLLARLRNLVSPQMPIQIEPDSDWDKNKTKYIQWIENWIRSGAPSLDGTISKEGLAQTHLQGCLASYRDTGKIERRPFSGPLLLDSLKDSIELFVAFKNDVQDPLTFSNTKILFSSNPHVFDSSAVAFDLEKLSPSLREIGLYGDSVTYTHKVNLLSKSILPNNKQIFFRIYLKDQANPISELPTDLAIYSMKKYMSFERIQ
ncbi:MAG: hypothetical protein ABI851_14890 [Saprospiraceae bacterium]